MKKFILFFSLLIVNLFAAANFQLLIATIRYVSHSGSSTPPYTSWETAADSIQKCINYSLAGDTIYVANGVYKEKIIVQNKFLTLIGSSQDSCIIDSRDLATPSDFYAFYIEGNIHIKNFCVIVSYNHTGCGILTLDSNNETIIEDNKIQAVGYGVIIWNSDTILRHDLITDANTGVHLEAFNENYYPIIDSNVIVTVYNFSRGIEGSIGTSASILNNLIYCEMGGDGMLGILQPLAVENNVVIKNGDGLYGYVFALGDGIIANNSVYGNSTESGFHVLRGSNKLVNNNLTNSEKGYEFESPDTIKFHYNNVWDTEAPYSGFTPDSTNIISDPMFVNQDSSDFHLQMYSPLVDAGDPNILDKDGSRSDIGLFGGPLGEQYTYRDLAPKPPGNLTAVWDSGLVLLRWNRNTEADFSHYRVYRDTVPDFMYDSTRIIGETADTFYYDDLPEKYLAMNYYYKITALDRTGHQSAPSEEVQVKITGVPEGPPKVIERYQLLNNYPNPFNSTTIIPYRLKEQGFVKLYIYDIKGELVRVLVNQYQGTGYYEVKFSPSVGERKSGALGVSWPTGYNDDIATGIYLYQIIVIGEGNIPVYTNTGKMILLK